MAEEATLARPYAKATFGIAREAGDDGVQRWERRLELLATALETPEVLRAVSSPAMLPVQKAELLAEILGEDSDGTVRNFLRMLAENKRLTLLPEVYAEFTTLRAEWERTLEVEVVSAFELDDAAVKRLSERLSERFARNVEMTSRVDPELLGGVVIRAGDTVIDGSIRGRLDKLADELRVRI